MARCRSIALIKSDQRELRVSAGPPGERRRYQHPIILQRVGLLVRVPYDADDPPGERTASIEWTRQVHRRLLAVIGRSEEHTSELQSLMRISYAVFCLKKQKQIK